MLTITATPRHTGVKISGDYFDLDELNQAIYRVIGDEDDYYHLEGSRMRILGVCYEIRHAAQGDRNVESVFNGLHEQVKKQHGFIAPDKNVYFSAEILWPEVLYTAIALKNFTKLYRESVEFPEWDIHLPIVHHFQSLILDCLHGHVKEDEYQVILKAFNQAASVEDYATQYVDYFNLQYIKMTKQQREKSLSTIAVKLANQDKDYQTFRQQVLKAATPAKKAIHEIPLQAEYPEQIEW
ncbi:DUF6904 family protein [Planococcus salinus]|uniref:Uncharacterized protein n=1 Tax=Planococcus salinus TaxID=1848460 RepID=A0A3M8P7K9_9BACL|nr:hypothetical protein [Planococcus salinus]RNF39666.1 hypothetical protein EEX84_06750 [Planococcus salinus]